MASELFALLGSYVCGPASGSPSGDPDVASVLDERLYLKASEAGTYHLDADGPQALDFGGCASAAVVVIRAQGGKVKVRISSADGEEQVLSCDPLLIQISKLTPATSIDVERVDGVETIVRVFLGESA